MSYLLDTHALIWLLEADPKLPSSIRQIIEDKTCSISISIATLWEITVKNQLGKLTLQKDLADIFSHITHLDFEVLPIQTRHLLTLQRLPFHHRDPFDRLLIAQSISENKILFSKDRIFKLYGIDVIWEQA